MRVLYGRPVFILDGASMSFAPPGGAPRHRHSLTHSLVRASHASRCIPRSLVPSSRSSSSRLVAPRRFADALSLSSPVPFYLFLFILCISFLFSLPSRVPRSLPIPLPSQPRGPYLRRDVAHLPTPRKRYCPPGSAHIRLVTSFAAFLRCLHQ